MTGVGLGLTVDDIAQAILSAVVAHFTAAGVALPTRQYVAAGEPQLVAWDCEQVTVSLTGVGWGVAQESFAQTVQLGARQSAQALRHGVFSIEIVRSYPTPDDQGGLPSVDDMNTAGLASMRDAGLLSQAMVVAASEEIGLPPEATARPGVVDPRGPEGGYVGVLGTMIISLTGLK